MPPYVSASSCTSLPAFLCLRFQSPRRILIGFRDAGLFFSVAGQTRKLLLFLISCRKVHHVAQFFPFDVSRKVSGCDIDDALKGLRQMEAA